MRLGANENWVTMWAPMPRAFGQRQFLDERGGERGRGDARMPFRIAGQPHLLHAAIGEQAVTQQRRCVAERAGGSRHVAADQQHLANAREAHGLLQEGRGLGVRADAARGHVRHGLQPGIGERSERGQRVGELAAGQVIDIDRRAGGQEAGDQLRILGCIGAHLERAAGDQLGGRRGDVLGVRRRAGGLGDIGRSGRHLSTSLARDHVGFIEEPQASVRL